MVRMTRRWSGMDSNVQFRARYATVSRVHPSGAPVNRAVPASAYRSTCWAAIRGAAAYRTDQAASHRAALSAAQRIAEPKVRIVSLQRRVRCELAPAFRCECRSTHPQFSARPVGAVVTTLGVPLASVRFSRSSAIQAATRQTGIVAAGIDADGNGWVLADESGQYAPTDWARRAIGKQDEARVAVNRRAVKVGGL
jgi:hypothetical protein